jgi:autotransporter-associated beta strand protein
MAPLAKETSISRSPSQFLDVLFVLSLGAVGATGWAGAARASDGTWNVDGTGDWSDAAKWLDGKIADGVGATANLTFDITANNRGPAIDTTSRTVGILNIGDRDATHYYKITTDNGGKLIFDNGVSKAQINQVSTSFGDMIVAPIQLRGSLDITNLSGDRTLTIATGGITSIATSGTQAISNLGAAAGNVTISGAIGDGPSGGKIAVVQNNSNDVLTLSGNNTFSGGVTLIAGTLKIGNATALGAAGGKLTITGGKLDSDGKSISNNNPQEWNGDFTYSGASGNLDLGAGAVTMNASRKVTVGAGGSMLTVGGVIGDGGGGYGLTKLGAGILAINGSAASTFTGGLSIQGGTLLLDFTNLNAPTNLINSGNALTLGSGTLSIIGNGAGTTSQAFAGLTITGGARILLKPNGGAGTTVALGSIATVNAVGRSLLAGTVAGAGSGNAVITTTDNKDGQGIYGGRVVYTSNGGDTSDWATTASSSSPYTLGAYGAYTTMAAGAASDSSNAITGSLAIAGNHTHNTLKLTGGATLGLGANTLTLTSGGLLSTGPGASTISGTAGGTRLMGGDNGSGGCDLIVHQYNTGGLTISAVIGDNGTHPTALTKCGGGPLTLSGNNTYGGDTIISAGTLKLLTGGNNNIANSARIIIAGGAILDVSGVSGAGGFKVVSGQTLGGAGAIVGTLAVNAGGTLAPGASAGPLSVGTNVTMAAGAIYNWEFDGANADKVDILGDLRLDSGWKLAIVDAAGVAPAIGVEYDLFTYTGTFTGSVPADIIASPSGWPKAAIAQDTTSGAGRIYLKFASPAAAAGDTNADGVVDAADFVALKKNLGQGTALGAAAGDFTGNGQVNWADLGILMSNMGSGSLAATMAPEPTALALLAIGALAFLRRRRS